MLQSTFGVFLLVVVLSSIDNNGLTSQISTVMPQVCGFSDSARIRSRRPAGSRFRTRPANGHSGPGKGFISRVQIMRLGAFIHGMRTKTHKGSFAIQLARSVVADQS